MQRTNRWARFKKNISRRMASGLLVLVPVGVTVLVIWWLFSLATGLLRPAVSRIANYLQKLHWTGALPDAYVDFYVYVLAIVSLLVLLYLIGVISQHFIGRRLIAAWERLWLRIPLARTVYGATKQVVEALAQPQGAVFKAVVVVDFPYPDAKALGFVTGYVEDSAGRKFAKVLIPTTPNPTTGFLELIPLDKMLVTDLSIEDGFRMVMPFNFWKVLSRRSMS